MITLFMVLVSGEFAEVEETTSCSHIDYAGSVHRLYGLSTFSTHNAVTLYI